MPDTIVFPREGRPIILGLLAGAPRLANQYLSFRLFADFTGDFDTTLTKARFTEVAWPGYAPIVKQFKDNRVINAPAGGEPTLILEAAPKAPFQVQWGTRTAKGFWVQDNHTTKILVACLFSEPAVVNGPGFIEPVLHLSICQCPAD